jgi:hypothetical protein
VSDHLDLDALADVLADGHEPAHLAACDACRGRLADLKAALPQVAQALAAVPLPEPPTDLAARLSGAIAREAAPAPTNVLPMVRARTRWLPALAGVAAAAVLVTGGVLLLQKSPASKTSTDASTTGYRVNTTGTDYTAKDLPAALPGLLAGTAPERAAAGTLTAPQFAPASPLPTGLGDTTTDSTKAAAPDPLADLRTTAGLARCLASLTDPSDSGLPLALDYATFQGTPALVVVLPSSKADKVDVLVVPAGCARADGQVLYFTRLPKP